MTKVTGDDQWQRVMIWKGRRIAQVQAAEWRGARVSVISRSVMMGLVRKGSKCDMG